MGVVRIEKPAFNVREKITELEGTIPPKRMPRGSVIQTVVKKSTGQFTSSNGTAPYWVNIPTLTLKMSPIFPDSRLLLDVRLYIGFPSAGSAYQSEYAIFKDDGIPFDITGEEISSRTRCCGRMNNYHSGNNSNAQYQMYHFGGQHEDPMAGTTNEITWDVKLRGYSSSTTVYVNRAQTIQDSNADYDGVPQSTFTIQEIKT